jgi:hypothetical protein
MAGTTNSEARTLAVADDVARPGSGVNYPLSQAAGRAAIGRRHVYVLVGKGPQVEVLRSLLFGEAGAIHPTMLLTQSTPMTLLAMYFYLQEGAMHVTD